MIRRLRDEDDDGAAADGKAIKLPRRRKPDPLMPELELREIHKGTRPGTKFVRLERKATPLRRTGESTLEATREAERSRSRLGRVWQDIRAVAVGAPLATANVVHERLSKVK
ncbi:MAG TPA: hypothetical protein VFZ12_00380, partial [Dehalococcoidia bacterium]|nr:hypothetical protein [Dehalococcoidia bacterium]